MDHPSRVARRSPPDAVALQVILGSLRGDARLVGPPGARRLRVTHSVAREDYLRWKYDRLGSLVNGPPQRSGDHCSFETIAHPLFDDLAERRLHLREMLQPLGFAVWLTDVGRLAIRADQFLPAQRDAVLAA